jgi:hypothetical protein
VTTIAFIGVSFMRIHSLLRYLMVATKSPDMAASCGPQLDQSC